MARNPFEGKTPSYVAAHLKRRRDVLDEIVHGLKGGRFRWGQGEASGKERLAFEFGVNLVTATAAKRQGHEVKPKTDPCGSIYFGAPIQAHADVYVLGVQTRPKPVKAPKPAPLLDAKPKAKRKAKA